MCCDVMYAKMVEGVDEVLAAPPKGKGASLAIEYLLPRPSAAERLGSGPDGPAAAAGNGRHACFQFAGTVRRYALWGPTGSQMSDKNWLPKGGKVSRKRPYLEHGRSSCLTRYRPPCS